MDLPVDVFYLLLLYITTSLLLAIAMRCAKFIFVFAVIETAFGVAFIGRAHSLEWDFAKLIRPIPPLIILYVSSTHCSIRIFFFFFFRPHNDIGGGGGGGVFLNFLLFKLCKTPLLIISISILRVLITSLN